jgi:dTDP-4-amino-4,6-dideoxygalactose transaminase
MRIGRTLPPAAAPIYLRDIFSGIRGFFSGQPELQRFESELKKYLGMKYCFLFSSGKAALAVSLSVLKDRYPERDKVIIPAYICYSVPSAVIRTGLKVIPCDLKPDSLEMNLTKLAPLLTETTLCVIAPHLFGLPAPISEIGQLCREKGIIVIEDAAQALGVTHNGIMLGTQADIGFFSLGRGKILSTVEGGILITKDASVGTLVRARQSEIESYTFIEQAALIAKAFLLYLFSHPNLYWFPKLLPFLRLGETIFDPNFPIKKMSGVQAGFANNWKKKLKNFNTQRKRNVLAFMTALSDRSLSPFVSNKDRPPACLRLPLFIKEEGDREHILSESEKKGLGVMFTYPDSIDAIPKLSPLPHNHEPKQLNKLKELKKPDKPRYPEAKRMVQHIVTLPVHPMVSKKDTHKIIALLDQKR